MKSKRVATLMALAAFVVSVAAQAVPAGAPQAKDRTAGKMRCEAGTCPKSGMDLNLTEAQKAEVKRIMSAHREEMKRVQSDTSLTRDQKAARAREIKRAGMAEFRQTLTPEQQKKLDEKQQLRGQKMTMTPEKREALRAKIDGARKELNLTSAQESKIKQIIESRKAEFQSLHESKTLTPEQKRAEFKKMHTSVKEQIRQVLTPDQQKKFDEMASKARAKYGARVKTQGCCPAK